jgi:outer membrane protein TolC
MRVARSLAACFVVGTLAACKVGPNFTPPHPTVPEEYAGMNNAADGGPAPVASTAAPASFWWQQFHDPALDRLEEHAAAGNLDLQAAFLRIVEAREQVQSARAEGLPSLNASASYSREQFGLAGIIKSQHINQGADSSSTEAGLISALESPVNLYQLGFDASWELDLFGKVRRSVEAADARSTGAVESRNDLLVSLEAEVAQDYFQLRAAQMVRTIIDDQIAAQRVVFDLTQNRRQHGLADEADVESARAQ